MTEQAIATVEELPAELRAELVAKREAGTTLAELKKAYPQVAPAVIREVLPPLPKPTAEAKPKRIRGTSAKPTQTAAQRKLAAGQVRAARQPEKGGKPATTRTEDRPTDAELLKLANKVVALREKKQLSWLRIGAELKLAEGAATPKAGASKARALYRKVRGADASTAALAKA